METLNSLIGSIILFALAMVAMSVGVLLSGRKLKGSCGIDDDIAEKLELECGSCRNQEADMCPSSEDNGELVQLATLGAPNRKEHP
jgi:hypothetical protein